MTEYIGREAVKAEVRKRLNNPAIIGWLIRIVDAVPAADVAPVVRCKDCKWYQKATDDELSKCLHPSGYVGEGMGSLFHCCMGERKDGDDNG